MVRTRLGIDLLGDPLLAFNQDMALTGKYYAPAPPPAFAGTNLSVRVGDESFTTNGVMGYFIGDDYTQFYAASTAPGSTAELRRQLVTGGSLTGALTQLAAGTASGNGGSSYVTPSQPIPVSPKQQSNGVVSSQNSYVYLTLLVDPAGRIPVVSGAFPVLYGDLPAGPVATALAQMSISFRVGPLLLEPSRIKMPVPSEIHGDWAWMERQSVTLWAAPQEPAQADATPALANVPLRLREGWLVLSKAETSS